MNLFILLQKHTYIHKNVHFMKYRRRKQDNLQMMAMRELKLPMLKHSRATSMKNSTTRALCFFFTGCRRTVKASLS